MREARVVLSEAANLPQTEGTLFSLWAALEIREVCVFAFPLLDPLGRSRLAFRRALARFAACELCCDISGSRVSRSVRPPATRP